MEGKLLSTKVTFKIEKYDSDAGKNVTINKSFDKLNPELAMPDVVLDELGNLIVNAIDGRNILDIVITEQKSVLG